MRREELRLRDILEAADAILGFIEGKTRDDFLQNDALRSGVLFKLAIIGEAAARIAAGFREEHPEVEWADIIAFRNVVVHEYFALRWPTIWDTATEDVPALRRKIAEILSREFPG
jgi:uncharacterized protein with HEPN domain